jgi:GNAT superfamily N-acetyltransferase
LQRLERQAHLLFPDAMRVPEVRKFKPNDRDWLVDQHRVHYAREEGFDSSFGQLVAEIVDGFVANHDPTCEAGWIAELDGKRLGSVFCVRQNGTTAKLRLFLLVPEARGMGLGKRLLRIVMDYAQSRGYAGLQLWTHESHRAACALYRAAGWSLDTSKPVRSFGQDLVEQQWSYKF